MQKRLFLSLVFLLGLVLGLSAQQKGQVTGIIRDAETNETLIGVSIYEESSQLGATTNEKGRFELDLPYGDHVLRISYVGYTTVNKKVNIGSKPVSLNVKLEPESERLSEVQVTSERKDRNVTAMAMSVQTLDMITSRRFLR